MQISKMGYAAVGLLSLHGLLLAYSAYRQSPTLNEPGHLAAGVSNWQFGWFDVYNVNPPLVRMVAALPVVLMRGQTDWGAFYEGPGARPEFPLGEAFVAANGARASGLFTLARWACIPFSLLGGWICYRWGAEIGDRGQGTGDRLADGRQPRADSGQLAGMLALALWCFCPNVLAHGSLITPDMGATALAAAACYGFWRWLKAPTWWGTLGSGLVLGLAELAKTTLVVFYPLWVVMWGVCRWSEWREGKPSPCPLPKGEECSHLAPQDEIRAPSAPEVLCQTGEQEGWPVAAQDTDACLDSSQPDLILRSKMTTMAAPHSSRGARWIHSWWLRELAMLAARMIIAVYVINLGYAFEGSLTRLGDFKFVSATLGAHVGAEKAPPGGGNRFADSWLAALPVPLPKNYVLGIDLQKRDFEKYGRPSYLRSEFREEGWWYYYLYALAIKVPLGTWLLVGMAALAGVLQKTLTLPSPKGRGVSWRDEFVLLAPAVVILVFVSSQTGFSEHMRYVLPCFPFVFVWVGRVAFVFSREWWGADPESPHPALSQRARVLRRVVTGIAAAALAWSIGSSLWVYPHSLSYFNELVGGPTGGPEHLIHSNVDWGQDLLFLKDWLEEHPEAAGSGDPRPARKDGAGSGDPRPARKDGAGSGDPRPAQKDGAGSGDPRPAPKAPINLVYFGYFDPRHVGIVYAVPEELLKQREGPLPVEEIPPGWYAVSVNFVRGYPWFVYKPDGTKVGLPQNALTAFQQLKPVAMAGYSIYIYEVKSTVESLESRAGSDRAEK